MTTPNGDNNNNVNVNKELLVACDELIVAAKKLVGEPKTASADALRKCGMTLIEIKQLNRKVYEQLEVKRKQVECRRKEVEKLNLYNENLKYKQAYLRRQINVCRDLVTPSLQEFEKESEQAISTFKFNTLEELKEIHQQGLQALRKEKEVRKEMQAQCENLETLHQLTVETLDKKRKFVDEFPTRVSLIKSATVDLDNQFQTMIRDK